MSKALRNLQARKAKLAGDARAIADAAAAASREMTEDEEKQFDALVADIGKVDTGINREISLASIEAGVDIPAGTRDIVVIERSKDDPKGGFRSFGEFCQAVLGSSMQGARVDPRLVYDREGAQAAAPTTFGSTLSGADGGFLIPPEFSTDIYQLSLQEDAFLPLTDNVELSTSNSMVFPKDETTPWGTDGIRAYWQAEGQAGTQTKPKLTAEMMRLHKLMALIPLTDELMADARALETYIPGKVAASIRWKTNEAFLFGVGGGTPVGAFLAGGGPSIIQAKETSQATGTVVPLNLARMQARLLPGSFGRSIWLIANDILPLITTLTLGNYPIYLPPMGNYGGIVGAPSSPGGTPLQTPYGMLLGRPVYLSQHAGAAGAQGDIMLADWKGYRTITKAGGLETATSMHLYFDADATAFRTIFRVDGQPILQAPVNQAKGSNTLSHFIQLAARP
jgi:HK97 family phage major capsid protein